MNLFELAWTWYEDYTPHLFVHENKTKAEFEFDVKDAYKKYGDEYIKSAKEHWVGASDWTDFVASKLSDYGYTPVAPIQVSCFGAFIIKNKEHDDDDRTFAEEFIGEELLKKAVEHNSKVRSRLNKGGAKKGKTMHGYYKLVDRVPVECDLLEPGVWDSKNRRVDETEVCGARVSTVFLVLDHSFDERVPVLFETMVFGGVLDMEQDRYCTWDEAVAGHAAMVKRVKAAQAKDSTATVPTTSGQSALCVECTPIGDKALFRLNDWLYCPWCGRKVR